MNTHASLGMHKMFDRFDISSKVYFVTTKVESVFSSINSLVKLWIKNSRGRNELAQMSPYMLKDIGLTEADVIVEIRKPFWRA